jgi:hypothetical protein
MSDWQRNTTPQHTHPAGDPGVLNFFPTAANKRRTTGTWSAPYVTAEGADWLASASALPASVHALWQHRPASPSVLPCGTAFDVVSAAPLLGRHILGRLWSSGPGSGPAAMHRGRILLFAAPGTAQRLPALLAWDEWKELWERDVSVQPDGRPDARPGQRPGAPAETFPPLLCHGLGDSVTVPALAPEPPGDPGAREEKQPVSTPAGRSRWIVAPDVRHPWLPGPEILLRTCLRRRDDHRAGCRRTPVRAGRRPARPGEIIFGTADRDARVYDVTRRR